MTDGCAGIEIILIAGEVKTEFPGPHDPLFHANQQLPSLTTSNVRLLFPVASGVVYPAPMLFEAVIVKL